MTLCIAKKINGVPHFASDSRITFGNAGHIDFGIKVFSVPVKIYAPTMEEANVTELYKEFSIGMCIAGSTVNAYIVKEAIYEILQYLQYVPGYTDVSMDGICRVIKKVLQKTTQDICAILGSGGLAGIMITGFCLEQQKFRTYKFNIDTTTYPLTADFEEILLDKDIEFMGKGSTAAQQIHTAHPEWNSLKIIREVIQSNIEPTVGGGLQFGEYNQYRNFIIRGVQDYKINTDGYPEYLFTLRGVELYKGDFETGDSDFHIAYNFMMPFEGDIEQIWKEKGID